MIFKRLNEEAILDLDEFNDLKNDSTSDDVLNNIRYIFNVKEVFDKNKELVRDCVLNFKGHSNPDVNKFLDVLINIEGNNKYLPLMYTLYSNGEIDLKNFDNTKDYYDWASLNSFYEEESDEAIKYKARIFDIVSNPEKLSKFFQNTDNINIKDLYLNKNTIKKASLNDLKDKDSIYYQVAKWDYENDHQQQSSKGNKKVKKETLKNLNAENKKALNNRIKYLRNQLQNVLDDPTKWTEVYLEIEKLNDELSNLK